MPEPSVPNFAEATHRKISLDTLYGEMRTQLFLLSDRCVGFSLDLEQAKSAREEAQADCAKLMERVAELSKTVKDLSAQLATAGVKTNVPTSSEQQEGK